MNDIDRNTRTLVVSFMIAIFALIPLRFIEVGEQFELTSVMENSQVLGETIELPAKSGNEVKLEAPYDELENNYIEEESEIIETEMIEETSGL